VAVGCLLLLEDGSGYLELEDGTGRLELESCGELVPYAGGWAERTVVEERETELVTAAVLALRRRRRLIVG